MRAVYNLAKLQVDGKKSYKECLEYIVYWIMQIAVKRTKHRRERVVILNREARQVTLTENHRGCGRGVLCEYIYNHLIY